MADADDQDKREPSALDKEALFRTLKGWICDDSSHSSEWRKQAREDFGFVAGDQWTAEERSYLEAQQRVPITFNRALSIIKAVSGTEINGRHETRYIPRGTEDAAVNEVLTAASQWMGDQCDAEDEQSAAFQDCVIAGMGWTEPSLSYEDDPEGEYTESAIDPLEMYWDCKARKKNLQDARRVAHAKKISIRDARAMFPGFDDDQLNAAWVATASLGDVERTDEEKRHREENTEDEGKETEVTIVRIQWFEREPYHIAIDPLSGERVELDAAQAKTMKDRHQQLSEAMAAQGQPVPPLKMVPMTRKVYKQAFLGSEGILEMGDAPCKDHFSFQCITGERDKNKGTWFGLARVMRDPQKWANKWLSQTLHIMNTTAKGGIIAEKDAFEDQRQAEDTFAQPNAITWAAAGSISGQKPKIMDKPGGQFPAGYMQLMEFAISSIRDVTGINLELMGMRDANQPGILEAQRKQAAMTILATLFDSLRRFRKNIGRIRLYFIQEFLSDGRLIRITGPEGEKGVPLVRESVDGDYDVIVDDAPTSPNQKEQNWQIIMPMLPLLQEKMAESPELAAAILETSPLPSKVVEMIKEALMPSEEEQAQQAEQAEMMKASAMAEISKTQAGAQKDAAAAEKTQAETQKILMELQATMAAIQVGFSNQNDLLERIAGIEAAPPPSNQQGIS